MVHCNGLVSNTGVFLPHAQCSWDTLHINPDQEMVTEDELMMHECLPHYTLVSQYKKKSTFIFTNISKKKRIKTLWRSLRPAETEASESQKLQKTGGRFSKNNVLVDFLKSSFRVPKTFTQYYRSLQQSIYFSGRFHVETL